MNSKWMGSLVFSGLVWPQGFATTPLRTSAQNHPDSATAVVSAGIAWSSQADPAGIAESKGTDPATAAVRGRLTFDRRVAAQRALEEVYWKHRIWPSENPGPKPRLADVLSDQAIRAKVAGYLGMSHALAIEWSRPLTAAQLQAEIDRMARDSRRPDVLAELFAALGNDPHLITECLARPALTSRLARGWYAHDERFHGELRRQAERALDENRTCGRCLEAKGAEYEETTWRIVENAEGAADGSASAPGKSSAGGPAHSAHDAWSLGSRDITHEEWTALVGDLRLNETIGTSGAIGTFGPLHDSEESFSATAVLSRGGDLVRTATVQWRKASFDEWWKQRGATIGATIPVDVEADDEIFVLPAPSLSTLPCSDNTWSPLPLTPPARTRHTAIWTGTEMIVWGGLSSADSMPVNSRGRYAPSSDSWVPTGVFGTGTPEARSLHTAVWTGSEMIVWGGQAGISPFNTGGRYDPSTDTWSTTKVDASTPQGRSWHTGVWTGREMIVWGGVIGQNPGVTLNTGGRYDPTLDEWTPTSLDSVPSDRKQHTAVWTGTEMIVWGGIDDEFTDFASGARYSPATDSWSATSEIGAPSPRGEHSAVWTGTHMIIWAGSQPGDPPIYFASGGRYDPSSNTWSTTSTLNAPVARNRASAVWTGSEMIVWGGDYFANQSNHYQNTGGRYNPVLDAWTATPTGAGVPSPRAYHRAFWTGKDMIVWGGTGSANTRAGGRYDPTSNSWVPMTTIDAPSSRYFFGGVLTGDRMIIWAGRDALGPVNNGGTYCYCTSSSWYRDQDGDGYGVAASGIVACQQPPGYVAASGDCDDTRSGVHPGAAEICDSLDNDCDGSADNLPPPGTAPAVSLDEPAPGTARLSWSVVPAASGYDLVRGSIGVLHASGGDFTAATMDCLANDFAGTTIYDTDLPVTNQGFWYLVRGVNCAGAGTFDSAAPPQVGSRDTEIAASGMACP